MPEVKPRGRMCAPLTIVAAPNIALIKYWGKADETLNIPLNTSISVTLDRDDIFTETEACCRGIGETVLILNGKQVSPIPERVRRMMRACAEYEDTGLEIKTVNSFPTCCGLASSSSGMAALAFGVAWFSGCGRNEQNDEEQIGLLARLGSGSACRSVYGGFVQWSAEEPSLPKQIKPHTHWPELRIIIFIFDEGRKLTSSSDGMRRSVETSKFLTKRLEDFSGENSVVQRMLNAIETKDFNEFSEIVMKESNKLHAICMDTYPPLLYLNDASRAFINFVHQVNAFSNEEGEPNRLAYSFDAGPNAFCFADRKDTVAALLKIVQTFATVQKLSIVKKLDNLTHDYCSGFRIENSDNDMETNVLTSGMPNGRMVVINESVFTFVSHLKDIIITKPGPAPLVSLGHP